MAVEEAEIHVGDIDVIFEATLLDALGVAFSLAGATTLELIFCKPNGTVVTQTAVLTTDGLDGKLQYTSVVDDLDQEGPWQIQANVVAVGFTGHSSIGNFEVKPNLA